MPRTPSVVFDELLVVLAQSGDRAALERLAQRWRPRHLAHAGRLLGRPDAAADAVQEAWVSILRGLGSLRDPARFRAWSMAVVTRRCRDTQRRAYRAPETAAVEVDATPAPDGAPDGAALDLRRGLAALPRDQRVAMALYYVDGFSVVEIAHAVSAPVGTVKTRLFHARRALRRHFDGETE